MEDLKKRPRCFGSSVSDSNVLRRSGRFKDKGPVFEENTVSDAYSVDDESSGDDFVDAKGKGVEAVRRVATMDSVSNDKYVTDRGESVKKGKKCIMLGDDKKNIMKHKTTKGQSSKPSTSKPKTKKMKKGYQFQTRISPKTLYNAILTLEPNQRSCLARIGFEDLLDFKLDGIPSILGFYVVDNFDEHMMVIKLEKGSIEITKQNIGEILGIRNDGFDLMAEENAKDDEMISDWNAQFIEGTKITPTILKCLIRKSKVADMNFKLNFIMLFASVMGSVKPGGICDLNVLYRITRQTDLSKINWCDYVWSCLKKCKDPWNRTMSNSYFLGPITFLAMLYVDGTHCNEFNVGRKRPPASFWTMELLKEREAVEINSGGIGKAELQGCFVKEDEVEMPEDLEGILWKLNKSVANIRNEKLVLEKTFEAASGVFPENPFISDIYQQYRAALHYQNGGDNGKGTSDVHTSNNENPQQENILPEEGATHLNYYDSPVRDWGPSTHIEVIKEVEEVENSNKVNVESSNKRNVERSSGYDYGPYDGPSFSLQVTQDFAMVMSMETSVAGTNTHVLGSADHLEPIKAVPVSICKPVLKEEGAEGGRPKRKFTKSQAARSPFVPRITDILATESTDEKKVENFLLNTMEVDQSAVLFETKTGSRVSKKEMASLVNGEDVEDAVIDAWSDHVNSLESLRDENSLSRFFFPTFIVVFAMESNAIKTFNGFFMDVEKKNERAGGKNFINLDDLVFIPVSNDGHKFLICFNTKFPAVNVIDSNSNMIGENYRRSIMPRNTNDTLVAMLLHKTFCQCVAPRNPNKAASLLRLEVKREQFYWQTDKRKHDSGVFLMRHMESYMGSILGKWTCGLETEGRKQNAQLVRLRNRYAATLLLSNRNLHMAKVREQLDVIEVAAVRTKKMKLPRVGK